MSRFTNVEDLNDGDEFRLDGRVVLVKSVERSPDRHHWRIRLYDAIRPLVIVPNGARFTLTNASR